MSAPQPIRSPRALMGRRGEVAAASWYRRAGFAEVARNWRCPVGELDLVLVRAGLVVFCEVKTRATDAFGSGHAAVTWRKQRKLRQLAEAFLAAHRMVPGAVRFDVASVSPAPDGTLRVQVFQDAF